MTRYWNEWNCLVNQPVISEQTKVAMEWLIEALHDYEHTHGGLDSYLLENRILNKLICQAKEKKGIK